MGVIITDCDSTMVRSGTVLICNDAEDSGRSADSQGQRKHGSDGETGLLPQVAP
jgi:hypothetical protein